MLTVIEIFKSFCKLNFLESDIERFDIQHYSYGDDIEGYTGYVYLKGFKKHLIIHHNGSFEWSEN